MAKPFAGGIQDCTAATMGKAGCQPEEFPRGSSSLGTMDRDARYEACWL